MADLTGQLSGQLAALCRAAATREKGMESCTCMQGRKGRKGQLARLACSTPAVVPDVAFLGAVQCAPEAQDGFTEEAQVLAAGVKIKFSRRRREWMPMQDDDSFAGLSGQFLQPASQIQ